ncbi:MAG: hypothetical protein IVZ94_06825 [Nitrospirae bacterium]|nr:hypothetical protein [Nitrospirota bacterium]
MKKSKYSVWIPSGIFSSHYLLERLPQIVYKSYGLTDEKIAIVEGRR